MNISESVGLHTQFELSVERCAFAHLPKAATTCQCGGHMTTEASIPLDSSNLIVASLSGGSKTGNPSLLELLESCCYR